MKKTFLLIAVTLTSYASFAQLSQGSILLGGSVGYTSTINSTTTNLTSLSSPNDEVPVPETTSSIANIGVNAGYFVADGFVLGLNLGYSSSSTPETAEYDYAYYTFTEKNSSYSMGVFAAKYFTLTDKFYFTGSFNVNYGSGNATNAFFNDYNNSSPTWTEFTEPKTTFILSVAPGLAYFPNNHWGITFKLNNILSFLSLTTKDIPTYEVNNNGVQQVVTTQNMTTSTFGIGAGLTPTLGINYVFGKGASAATTN
jgi:hypothetical protein